MENEKLHKKFTLLKKYINHREIKKDNNIEKTNYF